MRVFVPVVLVSLFLGSTNTWSQTGPGGVGNVTTNRLWLRSDKGTSTTVDNTALSLWSDQSGNARDFSAPPGSEPRFRIGVVNGLPVVRFEGGATDYMENANLGNDLSGTDYTLYTVGARRTNAANFFTGARNSFQNYSRIGLGFENTTQVSINQGNGVNTITGNSNYTAVNTFIILSALKNSNAAIGKRLYENGFELRYSNNTVNANFNGNFCLSRINNTYYKTDIAEVIAYNFTLNPAQRIIVDNYLGAKYNLPIANDFYAYEAGFQYEVAGIGQFDASSKHTVSKGSNFFTVSSPSDLNDNEYLIWGHNNASVSAWTTAGAPTDVQIVNRVWRFDQTGDVGTVSLSCLTSDLPPLPGGGYTKYVLLVDGDGDFTSGASIYGVTQTGSNLTVNNVTIPDGAYVTWGVIRPRVNFVLASSSGSESLANPVFDVTLNFIADVNINVSYSATGGTATGGGTDYTLTGSPLTIPAGSQSAQITGLTVNDDNSPESTETIVITLSSPTAPVLVGAVGSHTYSIYDNDGSRFVDFVVPVASGSESVTTVNIEVKLDNPDASSPVSVDYVVSGTATGGGVDYTLASGTIVFSPGATLQTLSLVVENDALNELNETVVLTLQNPSSNVNIGANSVFNYTIVDDDPLPSVSFNSSNSEGVEGSIGNLSIPISLSAPSGRDVTVNYSVTGTASNGVDYLISSSSLTIPAGVTAGTIRGIVIDDSQIESSETIVLTVTSVTGGAIGSTSTHTFTIKDDDFFGWTGPGGVGDENTNKLWLSADTLTSTKVNDAFVSYWNDRSGNGNNAVQTTLTNQPQFKAGMINGKPLIRFDGTNSTADGDFFNVNLSDLVDVSYTLFTVGSRRNTNANYFFGTASGTNNQNIYMGWLDATRSQFGQWGTNLNAISANAAANTYVCMSAIFDRSIGRYLYENGTLLASNGNTTPIVDLATGYIGRRVNTWYEVDIAEIITYNSNLNTTQKVIVDNYLSAKYNLPVAIDRYPFKTTHPNEVAGIGRTSATDMHTKAKGPSIILIENASNLTDGDYLLWGHDGASTDWTTAEAPVGVKRIAREWRFKKTGVIGTVDLTVDLSAYAPFDPSYPVPVLMLDADGDFTSGATMLELTPIGGDRFRILNLTIPDGYYATFGRLKPSVTFSSSSVTVMEDAGTTDIRVVLNFLPSSTYTVNYSATDGSAVAPGDYTLLSGTLTFTSDSVLFITPSIVDDITTELTETFTVTLSGPSPSSLTLGSITTFTVNILDNDSPRKIQFSSTGSSADESHSPVLIIIDLTMVDPSNETTADYTVSGTATGGGVDYTLASGTVTIPAGNTSAVLSIPVNDDLLSEANETIILTLSNASPNANLGTNYTYTYTIIDNDAPPVVQFASATSSGSEVLSTPSITVSLSKASGQNVTVNYTVSGTATGGGVDFILNSGTLTIPAGSTSATIVPTIVNDVTVELPETIVLTLSSPVGADLGSTITHTFTILDDDAFGWKGPGGVGDEASVFMWLAADEILGSPADNTPIGTWNDLSGNGNDATQANAGSRPVISYNVINSKPVVRFDGFDDQMDYNGSAFQMSPYTSIVVGQRRVANACYLTGNLDWTANSSVILGWDNATNIVFTQTGTFIVAPSASSNVANVPTILMGVFDPGNGRMFYENGNLKGSNTNTTPVSTYVGTKLSYRAGVSYPSDIAEIANYNANLNTAQFKIVTSYFAAKYGIPIPAAVNRYAYGSDFPNQVAGIGRDDAYNQHLKAKGRGIITISNPSNLTDGSYLMWGHDNLDATTWSTVGAPVDVEKMARTWRFDQTGSVGTVTVNVDGTAFAPHSPGYDKFVILIDADGNFTSGATILELVPVGGGFYEANNVSIPDGSYVTFGWLRATVQFALASSSNMENVASPTVQVVLNYIPSAPVTVDYATSAGTATSGVDFDPVFGTLTIPAGSTSSNITLSILNDVFAESSESFTITLSSPSAGVSLGTNSTHTYTINDDDLARQVSFAVASASADESFSPVTVTVNLNLVDGIEPTTVDYTVAGSATGGGVDYTLASGTLTIPAGQAHGTLTIPITDDLISEGDETIIITLSNPSNAILGAIQTYTYTIVDNDATPTVQFASSTSSADEGVGTANVTVVLSAVSGADITVNYSVSGTATGGGVDFTLASGTLVIPAGSTAVSVDPAINDDGIIEPIETIVITLSSPSGAVLGVTTVHTLSILDNDQIGITGPGGVGDAATNSIWLDATVGTGTTTDNTPNSSWLDQSGNGNNISVLGSAGSVPVYMSSSGPAGKPIIRFTGGTNRYYGFTYSGSSTIANSPYTIIAVGARRSGAANYFVGGDNTFSRKALRLGWSGAGNNTYQASDYSTTVTGAGTVNVGNFGVFMFTSNSTTGKTLYENNTSLSTSTNTLPLLDRTNVQLGAVNGTAYNVDIAEYIEYKISLNTTQRNIVSSYLSAKYDIAVAGNKYAYRSTHPEQVIGIGRESATDLHIAAKGKTPVTIRNASSLDNGDYLLLGHDNGALTFTSTGAPAGGDVEITTRKWKFDETGTIGTITIELDTSSFIDGRNSTFYKYGLIVSSDNDFSTTGDQTLYEMTLVSGSTFRADNVAISGDQHLAFVRFRPTASFTTAASSGDEGTSPTTVVVQLNYVPQTATTVNFTLSGTASGGGVDYTSPTSVVIPSGSVTATVPVNLALDAVTDPAETVIFTITSSSGVYVAGAANNPHTLTINDVPVSREIQFTTTSSSADEGFTTVNVQVSVNVADPDNLITVGYAVTGGTATSGGVDFTLAAGTLDIPAGQTTGNITISVVDDAESELNETIVVTLSSPTNATLGANTSHTYTIIDNDPLPSVAFTLSSSGTSEATTPASIFVDLSSVSGRIVTVNYAVSGGTATGGGVDYSLTSGTLTFNPGETSKAIPVAITNDVVVEPSETVVLSLSAPSGATLGSVSSHTLTILDDDFFGWTGPGGVGSSANNRLWLVSDKGTSTITTGTLLSYWNDQSGNGNNATQTTPANQPVYQTNVINGKPVVSFNGTSSRLNFNGTSIENSTFTAIYVGARRVNTSGVATIVFGGNNQNGQSYQMGWTGSNRIISRGAGRFNIQGDLLVTAANTYEAIMVVRGSIATSIFENGSSLNISVNTNPINALANYNPAYIGYDAGAGYASLDLAEAILYNVNLNTAQIKIVNSYLGARYNLTIANDRYAFDATHPNEVAGIGRDDANNLHTVAQGTSIIKISNASTLNDNCYMLWGHDNASMSAWTTTEAPTDVRRIAREWRFDQTGNVGTVTLELDANGLPSPPAGYTKLVCMIDADGDFTSGATLIEMASIGGGWYRSNLVNIPDGHYVSFGWLIPRVEFTLAGSNGPENVTPALIQVKLNYIPATAVSVNYTASDVSAIGGGVDYNLVSGTLTIPAGSTTANIPIVIVNDVIPESSESFTITLSSPSGGVTLGATNVHTYMILDDDNARTLQFNLSSSSGDESISPNINLTLTPADPVNPTTVNYTVTGTATYGSDHTLSSGTLTIPAGSSSAAINIPVINDLLYEGSETVVITLSSPTNCNLGSRFVHTYTIVDNDLPPTLSFASSASSVSEAIVTVYVDVQLAFAAGTDVTVNYSVTGGTATNGGVDFNLPSGTLIIPAGSTTAQIGIPIVSDGVTEGSETFTITLSGPVGATLTSPSSHTVTIIDESVFGFTGPGGVGDQNQNSLWLRSDMGITSSPIDVWADQSGNGNNATQTTVTRRPTTGGLAINGYPTVRFATAGGGQFLNYGYSGTSSIAMSPYTVFVVAKRNNPNANYVLGGSTNANQELLMGWPTNGSNVFRMSQNANPTDGTFSAAYTGSFVMATGKFNPLSGKAIFENGTQKASITNTTPISSINTPYIGRLGGTYYNVDVAEIIIYRVALNTAQQRIVENYLGAKYNFNPANDYYTHHVPGDNFSLNVAGIGQHSVTEFHNMAKGPGIPRIGNPSDLGNNEYLLWGHDNASASGWGSFSGNTPTGDTSSLRLARKWRVTHTGNVGTVSVFINTADLPPMAPGKTGYILIVDNDTNFTSGRVIYPFTPLSGTTYQATNVTLPNNCYFTIGVGRNVSITSGSFNSGSTWMLGYVPSSTEQAVISSGTVVTLTANQTVGSVQINAGGTLNLGSYTLTLNTGTLVNYGTFNAGTGTVNFASSSPLCLPGLTSNVIYHNLTLSGTGRKDLCDSIRVNGIFTIGSSATIVNSQNLRIYLGGNLNNAIGTFHTKLSDWIFIGNTSISVADTLNSIRINPGATLNMPAGSTVVNADIVNNGTFNRGTSTLVFNGNTTVSGTSTTVFNNINIVSGKILTAHASSMGVNGSWVNNGTFNHNNGTLIFGGSTAFIGSSINTLNNVIINTASSVTGPTTDLIVRGNWANNGTGVYNQTSGTIIFNNLTNMSGTGSSNFNNITITGTVNAGTHNFSVQGNWNSSMGTFNEGTARVTFTGTATTPTITTPATGVSMYQVTINKTAGTLTLASSASKLNIKNDLTMTVGNFNLNLGRLVLGDTVALTGCHVNRTSGVIYNGNVWRYLPAGTISSTGVPNSYGLFPIGDTLAATPVYRPFQVNGTISTGGLMYARHVNIRGVTDVVVDSLGSTWVTRTGNQYTVVGYPTYTGALQLSKGSPGYETFAVNLVGSATFSNFPNVGSLGNLRAVINDSCKGDYVGATGTVANPTVSRSNLDRNGIRGVWKVGTTSVSTTPLPVTLVNFTAKAQEGRVTLVSWTTYTEVNSKHFEVQRSFDGKHFETIGIVKSAGNSNRALEYSFVDNSPQVGYNYYRLRQVDVDEGFVYTHVVKVYFENYVAVKKPSVLIYPNPSTGKNFTVFMENFVQEEVLVVVKDITGRELFAKIVLTRVNNQLVADEVNVDLPPGIYLIVASDHDAIVSERLIVR